MSLRRARLRLEMVQRIRARIHVRRMMDHAPVRRRFDLLCASAVCLRIRASDHNIVALFSAFHSLSEGQLVPPMHRPIHTK